MTDLARRFGRRLAEGEVRLPDGPLVVAVSGGLDSTVLLHLLRFGGIPNPLVVAHFDHAMRPGSEGDALWVAGLARGWTLPIEVARAESPPANEAEARRLRYAFLERVAEGRGAAAILTAHHADDQAETVLFRALRGTGIRGLRGIPSSSGGRIRPLLPFWREELVAHARTVGLAWREDPTNLDGPFARTVLRTEILPRIEEAVSPGARRALVRLAGHAASAERAWHAAERILLDGVIEDEGAERIELSRAGLLAYERPVRSRVLRAAARRLGVHLTEAGTRVVMEFTSRGESGRTTGVPGGLRLSRTFEVLVLGRGPVRGRRDGPETWVLIPSPERGSAEAVIGGRAVRVAWGETPADAGADPERFDRSSLRFPLRIRAPVPGDRVRLAAGTKKLVRVLAEARVPREARAEMAVLADAEGRVLGVPGVARSVDAVPSGDHQEFYIGVDDAHSA